MKKIPYFESFAGIGAVSKAIKNKNLPLELIGFSEIDKFAINSFSAIHHVSPTMNYGDICTIDINTLPDFDFYSLGFPCFISGTLVLTNNGYKPIETIDENDYVLTHKNRFRKVVKPMINKTKELYKINSSMNTLHTTEEHPFYVLEDKENLIPKWIKAKYLTSDMYIGTPIKPFKNIVSKLVIRNSYKRTESYIANMLNTIINDTDTWFLLGYIFNNYEIIDKKEVHIEIDNNKDIINKLIQTINNLNDKLDDLSKFEYILKEEDNQMIIKNRLMEDFLYHFLPIDTTYVHLKNLILLPNNLLKSFLEGYVLYVGDYEDLIYSKNERIIANELIYCLNKVYEETYSLKIDKQIKIEKISNHKIIKDEQYIWLPIETIEVINQSVDVYNIEVEEDNSYVVENVIVHNCQDISVAGKQEGAKWICGDCLDENGLPNHWNPLDIHYDNRENCPYCGSKNIKKTRSSLIVESLKIIRHKKPKYLLIENVKNLISKDFKDTFNKICKELDDYGYNVYWEVLNGKHFKVPHNRERVIMICIKKEHDKHCFSFPIGSKELIPLETILQKDFDKKYILSDVVQNRLTLYDNPTTNVIGTTKPPYRKIGQRDVVYSTQLPIGCLTASDSKQPKQIIDKETNLIRKLTPLEYMLLMGFDKEDYMKLREIKTSDTQIYKQCGNSIIVTMLEDILIELLKNE